MLWYILPLLCVVTPLYLAQQQPCITGSFVNNRDGFPVTDIGPLNSSDSLDCLAECIDNQPCACRQNISDDGCSINAFSDCDFQARCCWNRYWSTRDLTSDAGDGSGRNLGQLTCDVTRAELNIQPGELRSLTLDLFGQYSHCGDDGLLGGWNRIDNAANITVPTVVCCDQIGTWLDCQDPTKF